MEEPFPRGRGSFHIRARLEWGYTGVHIRA